MELLTSQTNQLFDLLAPAGFSSAMFTISAERNPVARKTSTVIKYTNSKFYCSICCTGDNSFNIEISPGQSALRKKFTIYSWNYGPEIFLQWLTFLKSEIDVIDKWQQLKEGMPDFKLVLYTEAEKFNYSEFVEIESKVHLLKEKLKQISLTVDQVAVLNTKLDNCIELAKTANKFDWLSYFIGTITAIILTLAVTPENAKLVWEAVKEVFMGFLLA